MDKQTSYSKNFSKDYGALSFQSYIDTQPKKK